MKQYIQTSTTLLFFIFSGFLTFSQTQDSLPYHEMPGYPDEYTAGSMASRMVDGLGFRFYWATEGLREKDLVFRPTEESRSVDETIDHILSMSNWILNAIKKSNQSIEEGLTFEEKRSLVLINLKTVSDILLKSDEEDLKTYTISLRNGDTLPFWNFINGQIADCIWHCGQISSFRRMTGNPFDSKVSLLMGIKRD